MAFGIVLIVVTGILLVVTTILGFMVYYQNHRIAEDKKRNEERFCDIEKNIGDILYTISLYASTARKSSENDEKINVIIDMLIRNAKTEAVVKGLATINSPLTVTDDARKLFEPMAGELRCYYRDIGINLSENDLFLDVQKRFGDRILQDICIPLGLMNNACIALAISIAKEQD